MPPYREGPEGARPRAAAATEGAVADMVRQFADPHAFVRELVQNALDAGATRVLVRLERTSDGLVTSSVDDDGAGMTRAIIEGPLLTLFVSSKEGDSSKIGKYGVGFVSVFALAPDEVTVETFRDGEAWVVRLRPDHSYDLEHGDPRETSGTIVTLVNRMDSAAFSAHAAAIEVALVRWCRHAERPIELTVVDLERSERPRIARIDTPLAVQASVSVEVTVGDSRTIVGCAAGSNRLPGVIAEASFAGFYNRGLTLYETADETFAGIEGVRFKVLSSHLSHTLSRDNVRRDDAFERAMAQVREIIRGKLRSEVASEVRKRAIAVASGGDAAPYIAALEAALAEPIRLSPKEIWFPLAAPIEGHHAMTVSALRAQKPRRAPFLVARSTSPLTSALAANGRPVVLSADVVIDEAFRYVGIDDRALVDSMFVLATELADPGPSASAVNRAVQATLAAVGAPVERIALVRLAGASLGRASIVVPSEGPRERLVAVADVETNGRKLEARSALLLDEADEAVQSAYRGSAADAARRGHLLARLVLIEHRGAISAKDNERLMEAAFGEAT